MKQKDIAVILVIAGFSVIFAFIIASFLVGSPKDRQAKVQNVDAISADFPKPDSRYFNKDSVNPTQTVQIGKDSNPAPFN